MSNNLANQPPVELSRPNDPDAVVAHIRSQYRVFLREVKDIPLTSINSLRRNLELTEQFNGLMLSLIQPLDVDRDYDFELEDIFKSEKARLKELDRCAVELRAGSIPKVETVNGGEDGIGMQATIPQPPLNAKLFLYLFLERKGREEAVGDALEAYSHYVKELGKLRADIVFYQEVARCAWPFVKRMVSRLGGLVLLTEWIRKLTH